ncbi:MAG TPA: alpha/beta hydrolase [Glaciihabitans sp.]|nr:alpha/beta hydrolase [Glaciihabitans sp.]
MARTEILTADDSVRGPHGPVPVRWYFPPVGPASGGVTRATPPIVWVHGGGFFRGNLDLPETHEVASSLAAEGFRVVTVDYRLVSTTPFRRAHPFSEASAVRYPIPLDDVVAVVSEIQRENPGGVILGGASAGACLAAGAVLRLADTGNPPLAGVFFGYGFFHAELPERSPDLAARVRGHRRITHLPRFLDIVNRNYAGTPAALLEPHAFAGGHPLDRFPPTLMLDADRDYMRASGGQFAKELEAADIRLDYYVLPDAAHAFLNRPRDPAYAESIRLISEWAKRL